MTETQESTWDTYWSEVENETWLYARELIDLSWSVRQHFATHIAPNDDGDLRLNWVAAAAAADQWACSSTERRLLDLVLSLLNPDERYETQVRKDDEGYYDVQVAVGTRKVDVRDLGSMGSWRDDVAAILGRYITGQPPRPSSLRT